MLKIDRENKNLTTLDAPSLADASISERYDLQEFISNSPSEFFKELGLDLFLLGTEIEPSDIVRDRIDMLAVDKEGSLVVIELKRGDHKLQMLQAISYAAMLSHWIPDDVYSLLNDDQNDELRDFLNVSTDDLNRKQRVVLIAEAYDYALLVSAEWLSENYAVDLLCCRISLAIDDATGLEYLVCSNVYPTPELSMEAVSRGRPRAGARQRNWTNWETALDEMENIAAAEFFREALQEGQDANLNRRNLRYRLNGKRRWNVHARSKNAYVWQQGRFEDDLEFWKKTLTNPEQVKAVKRDQCLRFYLETENDFRSFTEAVKSDLDSVTWETIG